jgi:hypothetical protein
MEHRMMSQGSHRPGVFPEKTPGAAEFPAGSTAFAARYLPQPDSF